MDGDQPTPEVEEQPVDSPAPAGTEEVDYKKRFEDTQAWGTQQSQKAAQLEEQFNRLKSDPEAQREFLAELGYEIEEPVEEDDPLTTDENAALRKELAAIKAEQAELKQWRDQSTSEAENQQLEQAWQNEQATVFGEVEQKQGAPLSAFARKEIIGLALQMPPGENGFPPLAAAYAELEKEREAEMESWRKSKQTTHRVSPNGRAGTEQPDLSTHEGRVAFALGKLEQ